MLSSRTVSMIALTLIVAQLVVRGWLAATGNFYWDDLILIGRASSHPILSWDYLGHSHDGHFMPAAFLVAGISTLVAPVNWLVPAITLIGMQALVSLAVWRMIRILAPAARGGALAALAFYLFSPMTVPAFAWWAAALNTLPMQAAMAWIVGDAVLACRAPGRSVPRAILIRSSVIFVVALAFFEKSLFILPVALVVATLSVRFTTPSGESDAAGVGVSGAGVSGVGVSGVGVSGAGAVVSGRVEPVVHPISPLATAVSSARALWGALAAVFGVWLVVFFANSDATAGVHSVKQTAELVWRSINNAVVPSLVGGPWRWDRWNPSPPWGTASTWMIVAGWLVVIAVSVIAVLRKSGATWVLVLGGAYVVLAQIPVMWNRSSDDTVLELAQTMRYLPDSALVLSAAIALLVALPTRTSSSPARHAQTASAPRIDGGALGVGTAVLAALVVASSLTSLSAFAASWRDNPTGDYLDTAKASLAANTEHPMFDQSLPLEVLLPVAYPNNQISHVFGRLRDRPAFGSVTDELNVLDTSGRMVRGAVTPRRAIAAGGGACDHPELAGPARLPLDGPLINWRWTIALAYCANRDGRVQFWLDGGEAVTADVYAGLHAIYVQLDGAGTHLNVRPEQGLALHTGAGRVGEVVEARLLGE